MLSPGEIASPLRHVLRKADNIRSLLGEVVGFDVGRSAWSSMPPPTRPGGCWSSRTSACPDTVRSDGLVLPLLATHIMWINLVSDGAPALALGMDPAAAGVMSERPRARGKGAITGPMWARIVFVGVIMAVATLLVLDASLPGGLIEGSGTMRYAQTMAFTTLLFFSLFTVFSARSDEHSAFRDLFSNGWAVGGPSCCHSRCRWR
ncbi:MAG TPA: cation transporting ATPase C-terminal domain-containing protein [Methylomirabilota bacterium]|nr:cation transporting ATPase C-terminal domain-containing protein [Methylomirabilota bacterium]